MKKIKLYTMRALAKRIGTSYGYFKQLMMRYREGKPVPQLEGYKLMPIGEGKRSVWLAHEIGIDIELVDDGLESAERKIGNTSEEEENK